MSDPPMSDARRKPRRSRLAATLRALIRTRVTAGLLVVLPIWVTYLLIKFIFELMRDSSQWLVEAYLTSDAGEPVRIILKIDLSALERKLGHVPSPAELYQVLPAHWQWAISIASIFLTIFILYTIGLFTANIIGRRVIETFETLLEKVPLVKTVYRASKQILSSFAGEQTRSFQRVALIPFPDQSMRAVAFITSTFRDSVTGEELCTVFLPTTPNPTTGYLQVVRRGDLTELNWSVEQAVQTIMSGGILRPEFLTIVPNRDLPSDVLVSQRTIAPDTRVPWTDPSGRP